MLNNIRLSKKNNYFSSLILFLIIVLMVTVSLHTYANTDDTLQIPEHHTDKNVSEKTVKTLQRTKTCLVLSGGGALGIAHVGVLKVLEENRVPIDCITGTSMGAIVGGLYASGYSVDELEALVQNSNWQDMFTDKPPRGDKSFRRKQDDLNAVINFRLNLDDEGNLILPKGFVQGNKIVLSFLDFTLRSRHIKDFDKLPIPFRAVATDVETGKQVVLTNGSLSKAMKASMSIPGVFPPMIIDNKALVDGGMVNNLPINIARDMGAKIVIASGIPTELKTKEELGSSFAVLGQLTSLIIKRNEDEQRKTLTDNDVYIEPNIKGYSSSSFDKAKELIEPGIISAKKEQKKLQRYSVSPADYANIRLKQQIPELEKPTLAFVDVNNQSGISDDFIRSRISTKVNQPLNVKTLEQDLKMLSGLGYVKEVLFDVVDKDINGTSQTGIVVNVFGAKSEGAFAKATSVKANSQNAHNQNNKKYQDTNQNRTEQLLNKSLERTIKINALPLQSSKNELYLGVNLQDNFKGQSSYTLDVGMKRAPVNDSGGEVNLALKIGEQAKAKISYYQPTHEGTYFFEPHIGYDASNVPLYEGDTEIARFRLHRGLVGLDIGKHISNTTELRASINRGVAYADQLVGEEIPNIGHFDLANVSLSATYDTVDDVNFPHDGLLLNASYFNSSKDLGASNSYQQLNARYMWANTWTDDTMVLGSHLRLNLDKNTPLESRFPLGGFGSVSGYSKDELRVNNYLQHSAVFYQNWEAYKGAMFNIPIYTGLTLEATSMFDDKDDLGFSPDDFILSGTVFAGTETVLGPIYLGYGRNNKNKQSVYFFLGRAF